MLSVHLLVWIIAILNIPSFVVCNSTPSFSPTIGPSLLIMAADNTGNSGWGSATLVITESKTGSTSYYTPDMEDSNPLYISYTLPSFLHHSSSQFDSVTLTLEIEGSPTVFSSVQWSVFDMKSGETHEGDYSTTMTFTLSVSGVVSLTKEIDDIYDDATEASSYADMIPVTSFSMSSQSSQQESSSSYQYTSSTESVSSSSSTEDVELYSSGSSSESEQPTCKSCIFYYKSPKSSNEILNLPGVGPADKKLVVKPTIGKKRSPHKRSIKTEEDIEKQRAELKKSMQRGKSEKNKRSEDKESSSKSREKGPAGSLDVLDPKKVQLPPTMGKKVVSDSTSLKQSSSSSTLPSKPYKLSTQTSPVTARTVSKKIGSAKSTTVTETKGSISKSSNQRDEVETEEAVEETEDAGGEGSEAIEDKVTSKKTVGKTEKETDKIVKTYLSNIKSKPSLEGVNEGTEAKSDLTEPTPIASALGTKKDRSVSDPSASSAASKKKTSPGAEEAGGSLTADEAGEAISSTAASSKKKELGVATPPSKSLAKASLLDRLFASIHSVLTPFEEYVYDKHIKSAKEMVEDFDLESIVFEELKEKKKKLMKSSKDKKQPVPYTLLSSHSSSWHTGEGFGTEYEITSENDEIIYYKGTLCGSSNKKSGPSCKIWLPEGDYTWRVTGFLDPHRDGISWEFCGVHGGAVTELKFQIDIFGACTPLGVTYLIQERSVESGKLVGRPQAHTKSMDEAVTWFTNEVVSKGITSQVQLLVMDVVIQFDGIPFEELSYDEVNFLQHVLSSQINEKEMTYTVLDKSVTLASREPVVLSSADEESVIYASNAELLHFSIFVTTEEFAVDGASFAVGEMLSQLKSSLVSTVQSGYLLELILTEAGNYGFANLASLSSLELVSFELARNVIIQHENSAAEKEFFTVLANSVVIVGVAMGVVFGVLQARSVVLNLSKDHESAEQGAKGGNLASPSPSRSVRNALTSIPGDTGCGVSRALDAINNSRPPSQTPPSVIQYPSRYPVVDMHSAESGIAHVTSQIQSTSISKKTPAQLTQQTASTAKPSGPVVSNSWVTYVGSLLVKVDENMHIPTAPLEPAPASQQIPTNPKNVKETAPPIPAQVPRAPAGKTSPYSETVHEILVQARDGRSRVCV